MATKKTKEFDFENWTTQLRKGYLELCILNILAHGELYAYDLSKQLTKIRGLMVTEGTIYPLLSRLRKSDVLATRLQETPSGPARKYYWLTKSGHEMRDLMNIYWDELGVGVQELVRGATEERDG